MTTAPPPLGSDAWFGADNYEPGSELHTRAIAFLATVKWDALITIASKKRNGISCSFIEAFSIGHFNMARRLVFEDGTSWVGRLRFPTTDAGADREILSASRTMEVEIASMKFLGSKTSIPVPTVHAYSLSAENEVGAPFILMDYIHGSVADELRQIKNSDPGLFGTPEQDQKFREQVAQVQATVGSFRFPQIGGLYLNEITNHFRIGLEVQTGKGPWTSATDYYDDLTEHLLYKESKYHAQESPSTLVPPVLNFLQRTYAQEERAGPFRLTNRDFGSHNILVNDDFDIVGIIDFDGVMTAPIEAVAQYPMYCFLHVDPPGVVDTRPAVVERVAKTIPRLQAYISMLAKCEASDKSGHIRISDRLGSTSASIFQGLMAYQAHQDLTNEKWMQSCLKMVQWRAAQEEQSHSSTCRSSAPFNPFFGYTSRTSL